MALSASPLPANPLPANPVLGSSASASTISRRSNPEYGTGADHGAGQRDGADQQVGSVKHAEGQYGDHQQAPNGQAGPGQFGQGQQYGTGQQQADAQYADAQYAAADQGGAHYAGARSDASAQYGTGPLYVVGQQNGAVGEQGTGDHGYDDHGYDDQGYAAPGREEQVPPGLEFAGRFGNRGYSLYGETAEHGDADDAGPAEQAQTAGYGPGSGQFAESVTALPAPVAADAASGEHWSPNGAQARQGTGAYPAYGTGQPQPGTPGQAFGHAEQSGYQQQPAYNQQQPAYPGEQQPAYPGAPGEQTRRAPGPEP